MLLSIDRVLKLLVERKSIEKISELAQCEEKEVIAVIEEARQLLLKHEKPHTRKKIIIKKKNEKNIEDTDNDILLSGAELSAVPYESSLIFYVHGTSDGKPGVSGIGIVILDKDQHQVGKISHFIGRYSYNECLIKGILRAMKLSLRFNPKSVKIRFSDEFIMQLLNCERTTENRFLIPLVKEYTELNNQINDLQLELVPLHQNEKASFLSARAIEGK